MISADQLSEARTILALGGSLANAAAAIAATASELDHAIWCAGVGNHVDPPVRRVLPPARPKPRPRHPREPERSCRPWTGAEQLRLRIYWNDGVPTWVIARTFNRTEMAIRSRAQALKLAPRQRRAAA